MVVDKDAAGAYILVTGNEVGLLLLDYICSRRIANGTMPVDPVLVKTIVTTDMADLIAESYGIRTVNVLTGFKFIGEQIGMLEAAGKAVVKLLDYSLGLDGLPKSNVLKFILEDKCSVVVRPSGTEPKLKLYVSVSAADRGAAETVEAGLVEVAKRKLMFKKAF